MWSVFTKNTPNEQKVQIPKGNPKIGAQIFFQQCAGCHDFDIDSKIMEAPPLKGIIGKQIGVANYTYSKAMKKQHFIWTPQKMFLFLQKPSKVIPGNKMFYHGMPSVRERAHLIAYMMAVDEQSQ